LQIVDDVIPEPLGGAHREPRAVTDRVAKALTNQLFQLTDLSLDQLLAQRDQKYRRIGAVNGLAPSAN
jgi:acetyl-CoA carboxylase carboxyl transferase subunit alpha